MSASERKEILTPVSPHGGTEDVPLSQISPGLKNKLFTCARSLESSHSHGQRVDAAARHWGEEVCSSECVMQTVRVVGTGW